MRRRTFVSLIAVAAARPHVAPVEKVVASTMYGVFGSMAVVRFPFRWGGVHVWPALSQLHQGSALERTK